jgi:parvulin-like peptidyl-prolyl isomerase
MRFFSAVEKIGPCGGQPAARVTSPWLPLALLLVQLLMTAPGVFAQALPKDRGDDVIARVNEVVITRRAFQVVYREAVDQHVRQGQPVDEAHIAALRRSVIQRLVEEELLVQESRRQGIVVSDREVDAAVAAARARLGGSGQLAEELARRRVDETHYRRLLRRQLAIERLLARTVPSDMAVAEDELRRFYDANPQRYQVPEAVRLRRILVRVANGEERAGTEAARAKITGIKARLEQGADFNQLAQHHSEEPAARRGGDLGYVERGQLPPPLDAVAFDLAVGDISPVVATPVGFHLLTVTDRRPAARIPFEQVRDDIRQTLHQEKNERAVKAYIQDLRAKAEIQAAW